MLTTIDQIRLSLQKKKTSDTKIKQEIQSTRYSKRLTTEVWEKQYAVRVQK